MTEHFRLKERVFQNEKMAGLCILGENMAHQLNNPLTGLQSMAQILTGRPELKSFGEDFMEVEKAARRSQKIIESLLSFSSKNKERETICRLNQVVESALSLLKSATRGIALELDFADSGLKTRGDFSILQQVVYNLILNACQALNQTKAERKAPKTLSRSVGLCNQTKTEWKARIHISIRKAPEDKVLLKIRDNGPGIARENLQKIFQTFWTSKKKGTGLGLGMARKFVRELGGDIFVSSRQGEFASFAVFLPSAVSRPSPAKSA